MTKNKFINLCPKPRPNTPEMTLETVLVFGLESVSYERSQREARQNAAFFGARLFCNHTTLSEFKDICCVKLKMD